MRCRTSRRQPIHAASSRLEPCCSRRGTSGIPHPSDALLTGSPPEPQIFGRKRDGHVKWAAVQGALVCMQQACTMTITRHGRHSTAQKTDAAPERGLLQRTATPQRSIGSICKPGISQTASGYYHLYKCRQSWTLAAQSLPYLQASRRRTRFGTTSRGRARASGLQRARQSRTTQPIKHTGP